MGEREEVSSCQEILEFRRGCGYAAAGGLLACDSGERYAISF